MKLVATIDPPIAGVTVYFRVWDVDDPFDQLNATMPDVNLIDDDDDGPDNRPTGCEGVWSGLNSTDENGQAIKTFTVSMQPGNNYRAAATCLQHVFDPDHPHRFQVGRAVADSQHQPNAKSLAGDLTVQKTSEIEDREHRQGG